MFKVNLVDFIGCCGFIDINFISHSNMNLGRQVIHLDYVLI